MAVPLREQILARLLAVLKGIDGIKDAVRNQPDVKTEATGRASGLVRPAATLQDGTETFKDAAQNERFSRQQMMELRPEIHILVGANADDQGTVLNLFLGRALKAIITDSELQAMFGGSGSMLYEESVLVPQGPEAREARIELTFVFTYSFKVSDLD